MLSIVFRDKYITLEMVSWWTFVNVVIHHSAIVFVIQWLSYVSLFQNKDAELLWIALVEYPKLDYVDFEYILI